MIVNIFSTSWSLVKRRMRTDIIAENRRAARATWKCEDRKGARFRKRPYKSNAKKPPEGGPLHKRQNNQKRDPSFVRARSGCYTGGMHKIKHFECSRCGATVSAQKPQTVCPKCSGALYVRYDLRPMRGEAGRTKILRDALKDGWAGMWRYRSVLPDVEPVTLGEGWTPVIRSRRYKNVVVKEEGANPTGSFKARGLALVVTMAKHYGLKKLAVPSAGNAAGALVAYAAAAGIEAHIFMSKDVPLANLVEAKIYGAKVTLVDGLISDCGRMVAERKEKEGWFDISTLKEPFRVEGKKTMGYELVEQLGWEYPDAVFYPSGGGVRLIGMWKAFEEMKQLGWVTGKRPRMYALQAAGCAPVARAYDEGKAASEFFQG